jgi:hypothetical protein
MVEKADIPRLERITFFSGQRLTAKDLTELQRAHRELRWLHNRSLHGWGIGIGLAVTGERGASAVTIEPGYGVDCLGREIILTEKKTIKVPAVAGAPGGTEAVYYLVAGYQGDEVQQVAERRPGVCIPGGTVRLSEEPLIDWRRPNQLKEGLELVLAQVWIQNCQLSRPLSLAPRRYARPAQQPYIAAGQTSEGNTAWQEWKVNNTLVGVETRVDTSAAHFRTTPRYIAHIVGERFLVDGNGWLAAWGLPAVVDATPLGFSLQVFLMAWPISGVEAVKQLKWHVVWMGIEG